MAVANLCSHDTSVLLNKCIIAPCNAEINGDGVLDFFDVNPFLGMFSIGHPDADWNRDGLFDFFDVAAFLSLFAASCP